MSGLSFPFPRLHAYARMIRKAVLKTLSETRVRYMLNIFMSNRCKNECHSPKPNQLMLLLPTQTHLQYYISIYSLCTHTACIVICFFAVSDSWFGRSVHYIWSGPLHYAGDPERRTTHIRADLNFISAASRDHRNNPNTCLILLWETGRMVNSSMIRYWDCKDVGWSVCWNSSLILL